MSVLENTHVSFPVYLENLWEIFRKDPFSDRSVDFARLIAAYYLGFPLLAPRSSGSLPSLYEWPKLPSGNRISAFSIITLHEIKVVCKSVVINFHQKNGEY